MKDTSNTGLLACPTKAVKKIKQKSIQLKAISIPAPVVLRPYAGLYNPFPYGCSLLCNHPTDKDAKDILKRARETWATENKNIISPDELQAIRESLASVEKPEPPPVDNIPEELFRRWRNTFRIYTETDSRPLTPAPTLASVKTRGSSSRRCVTPDPIITSVLRERTLLILDLRRSHSQEVISWHGTNDVPVINVLQAPTPSISIDSPSETPEIPSRRTTASPKPAAVPQQKLEVPQVQQTTVVESNEYEIQDGEEDVIKRKGKRRRKRGRDSSRGPLAVQASIDPETQVSALGTDCMNTSARPSLVPAGSLQDSNSAAHLQNYQKFGAGGSNYNLSSSILQSDVLKHLQRELTSEILDLEFNKMRRAALEEAFKSLPTEKKPPSDEVIQIKQELNLPPINEELWLSLPRVFSRKSARFEMPLHSRILNSLTPLEYLKQHCMVSNGRRQLYNLVFNRHKDVSQENGARILLNNRIRIALGEMMGKQLSDGQIARFHELVDWNETDVIDFKTWCGICALFERVFAVEFVAQLPGKDIDPCNEVEIADFQSLFRRLQNVEPKECLVNMLKAIRDL